MKSFSLSWRRSVKARKQRKFVYNAPLHIRHNFLSLNLSKELRKKYGMRNLSPRKGDSVRVVKGSFKNKNGKIERIMLKEMRIFVAGIENTRKDGAKSLCPLKPNALQITELVLDDKKRQKAINRVRS